MSSIVCPVCAEHFSTCAGRGRSTTDNVRNHMKKIHRMSADEVDAILLKRGIIRPRVVVDDVAISQWNDLVARGVIG